MDEGKYKSNYNNIIQYCYNNVQLWIIIYYSPRSVNKNNKASLVKYNLLLTFYTKFLSKLKSKNRVSSLAKTFTTDSNSLFYTHFTLLQ